MILFSQLRAIVCKAMCISGHFSGMMNPICLPGTGLGFKFSGSWAVTFMVIDLSCLLNGWKKFCFHFFVLVWFSGTGVWYFQKSWGFFSPQVACHLAPRPQLSPASVSPTLFMDSHTDPIGTWWAPYKFWLCWILGGQRENAIGKNAILVDGLCAEIFQRVVALCQEEEWSRIRPADNWPFPVWNPEQMPRLQAESVERHNFTSCSDN